MAKLRFDGIPLAVVYRQLPLVKLHPFARAAASIAVCANERDQFQVIHTGLFHERPRWADKAARVAWLVSLGIDSAEARAISECADSERTRRSLAMDQRLADSLGISKTPTTIFGDSIRVGAYTVDALTQLLPTKGTSQ